MTYETMNLNDLQNKINQLNALINTTKTQFNTDKNTFRQDLMNIKNQMINELVFQNSKNFDSELKKQKEELQKYIKSETLASYAKNKGDLIRNINIDYDNLLSKNAKNFLALSQSQLNKALEQELKKEKYAKILSDFETNANNALTQTKAEFQLQLGRLDLRELASSYIKRAVQKDFKDLQAIVLKEQKSQIAKELLNHFLRRPETQELIKESLNEVLNDRFTQKYIDNEIHQRLISLNERLLEKILNARVIQKNNVIQTLLLSSSSVTNELNIINEHLSVLRKTQYLQTGLIPNENASSLTGQLKVV